LPGEKKVFVLKGRRKKLSYLKLEISNGMQKKGA